VEAAIIPSEMCNIQVALYRQTIPEEREERGKRRNGGGGLSPFCLHYFFQGTFVFGCPPPLMRPRLGFSWPLPLLTNRRKKREGEEERGERRKGRMTIIRQHHLALPPYISPPATMLTREEKGRGNRKKKKGEQVVVQPVRNLLRLPKKGAALREEVGS